MAFLHSLIIKKTKQTVRRFEFILLSLLLSTQVVLSQDDRTKTLRNGKLSWSVPAGNNEGRFEYDIEFDVYGTDESSRRTLISQWGIVLATRDFKACDSCSVVPFETSQTLFKIESLNRSYFHTRDADGNFITKFWRDPFPELRVLELNNRDRDWNATLLSTNDVFDSNLPSDQMMTSTANSSIGLSVTQRAYIWTNPDFEDFIIVEYILTNTGNYDAEPDIENPNNQLHEVYVGLQSMSQVSALGGIVVSQNGGILRGNDDWVDYYGEQPTDSLRVLYSWDGDAAPGFASGNDEGDPHPLTAQPLSPQYLGRAVFYAPVAVNDPTNAADPEFRSSGSEPVTTQFGHWLNQSTIISSSGTATENEAVHQELGAGVHIEEPFDWNAGQYTTGNVYATDEFLKTATMAFGPYEFTETGQSIRIVTCLAVGSISFRRAIELGQELQPGTEEYLSVIRTGRDSLFAVISKARKAFYDRQTNTLDFTIAKGSAIDRNIKDPLPAPSVHYFSDSAHVRITWQDVSQMLDPDTGTPDWAGYRVYRRVSSQFDLIQPTADIYMNIYESQPGDTTTHYEDFDVQVGRCFWYYVTAFDRDGIDSHTFLNRSFPGGLGRETQQGACAIRPQASDLNNVVVVPNPYHVQAARRLGIGTLNTLLFFNLPYKCRLKIFNQTGDLLRTIEKEDDGNVIEWNQISEAGQFVVSGLYIFVVDQAQDNKGNDLGKTIGKFVVIR